VDKKSGFELFEPGDRYLVMVPVRSEKDQMIFPEFAVVTVGCEGGSLSLLLDGEPWVNERFFKNSEGISLLFVII